MIATLNHKILPFSTLGLRPSRHKLGYSVPVFTPKKSDSDLQAFVFIITPLPHPLPGWVQSFVPPIFRKSNG